jgi:hypothetical protein
LMPEVVLPALTLTSLHRVAMYLFCDSPLRKNSKSYWPGGSPSIVNSPPFSSSTSPLTFSRISYAVPATFAMMRTETSYGEMRPLTAPLLLAWSCAKRADEAINRLTIDVDTDLLIS